MRETSQHNKPKTFPGRGRLHSLKGEALEEALIHLLIGPLEESYQELKILKPEHELLKYLDVSTDGMILKIQYQKEFLDRFYVDSWRNFSFMDSDITDEIFIK